VLSLDAKPLIDRAHRTLRRSPDPREPPRPFILRLHYYHVLEDILQKARAARELHFRGKRIQIFPDYPPAVAKRRALFNRARELLRDTVSGTVCFTLQDSWSHTTAHSHSSQTLKKSKNTRSDFLDQGHLQLQRTDKYGSQELFFSLSVAG